MSLTNRTFAAPAAGAAVPIIVLGQPAPAGWANTPMKLLGRRTCHARLAGGVREYSVSAQCGSARLASPRWTFTALLGKDPA